MRREFLKRVAHLENEMNLVASDALRSDVSNAQRMAHIVATTSRLEAWRTNCLRKFRKRGNPHTWPEYQGLRRFTQSVLMITWVHDRESLEPTGTWFWHVLHAVALARHCDGWGRALRIDARDAPIEFSLMSALLADGPDTLADVEIDRSPNWGGAPAPATLGELWKVELPRNNEDGQVGFGYR